MIRSVLFDLFGTLVEYDPRRGSQEYEATFSLLEKCGFAGDYPRFMNSLEMTFQALEQRQSETHFEFSMLEVFQRVSRDLGLSGEHLEALADSYVAEWSRHITPLPHVKDFLRGLKKRFRLGLITNTHHAAMVSQLLKEFELIQSFDVITTSVQHGRSKPHPAIFDDTLRALETAAHEAVYVGDNYKSDFLGAQGAGMVCYLVGNHARVPREYQISTALDLPVHLL